MATSAKNPNPESGIFSGQESTVSEAGGPSPTTNGIPMASASNGYENHSHQSHGSIYDVLEQKERDLLLAAELGKALLEKNEELSTQNEKMAEDFSRKLEVRLCHQLISYGRDIFMGLLLPVSALPEF